MRPQKSTVWCRWCREFLPRDRFGDIPRRDRSGGMRKDTLCRDCRANPLRRTMDECLPIPNPDDPSGETMLVPLTKEKFAIIDAADATLVSPYRWYALEAPPLWYAHSVYLDGNGEQQSILMHRLLLGELADMGDHWDGDGLNNRRSNLRPATQSQNMQNRAAKRAGITGFKGVKVAHQRGGWTASMKINGRYVHLGTFATPEEAARAYDAAALREYGEFARLNFPSDRHDD